jgi:hypothetical protein
MPPPLQLASIEAAIKIAIADTNERTGASCRPNNSFRMTISSSMVESL